MDEWDEIVKVAKAKNQKILSEVAESIEAEDAIPPDERERRDKQQRLDKFFGNYRVEERAKLCPSFVVFADLLGVRELILKSEQDETVLHSVSEALESAGFLLEGGYWSYFRYYSDCVSLITPVAFSNDPSHESEFGETVLGLGRWQTAMVIQGFPVRGGFAFGNLYVDERSLFGKAHLVAYGLESKTAVYPRIVLCPDTVELLRAQLKFYSGNSPQERHVLVDIDDQPFVSYLATMHDYYDEKEGELLESHRKLIEERLETCSSVVRDKYLWMRDYHNWICDEWSTKYGDFSDKKLGECLRQFRNLRVWLEESK